MDHIVTFERGHDCIKFECIHDSERCISSGGGSHGRHGLQIRFVSKGPEGAVQFLIYTGWIPQYSQKSDIGYRHVSEWGSHMMPADLGYHSKTPRYEDQGQISTSCEYCDGQPCYYDGSSLNASDAMYVLVNGGDEALWAFLDAYYEHVFGSGEYPYPAEYPKPIRSLKQEPVNLVSYANTLLAGPRKENGGNG